MDEYRETWRWNADLAWHYHCSMFYESAMAQEANNDFMRYHHVRSGIYFAVSALEAFLNGHMRRDLEAKGVPEEEIFKKLRHTKIDEKRKKWPSEICGREIAFPDGVGQIFEAYKDIRNETTHPKRRDHSIYPQLEGANPNKLAEAVSVAMVTVYEGLSDPFPYWVLGWNYVGMNNNPAHPNQGNNMNGFFWSLIEMGFQVSSDEIAWDKLNMVTLQDYHALKDTLDKYPHEIEPYRADLPMRPRLTRRWWDHEFIYTNIKETKKEREKGDMLLF